MLACLYANKYTDTSCFIYTMYRHSTHVRVVITVLPQNNDISAMRFHSNVLAVAGSVIKHCRECFNCIPLIESTSPLRVNSIEGLDVLGHNRQMVRRWSVQSGSWCTPMLVCAFVPVRSNLRGNISFLSNWPRTRARRYRAP